MSTVETRREDGGVLVATMRRGKANAIAPDLLADLHAALDEADGEDVRGLVITSGVERFFSAGLDVPMLLELDRPAMTEFMRELGRVVRRIVGLGKPVVAAMPGHAMAGGMILALTADWRIAAEGGAKMGLNEVELGLPVPDGAVVLLAHRVGAAAAARIALMAETLDAAGAHALGAIDRLVPVEQVEPEAIALARDRGSRPLAGFARTKATLVAPALERMGDDVEPFADIWFGDEAQGRLRALVASLSKPR